MANPSSPASAVSEGLADGHPAEPSLTILFDGGCPLCVREVNFLKRRDGERHRLSFVDIDAIDYDPAGHGGIDYREAMGRIHAIGPEGEVLRDVEVFRRAYALIGLGWLYAPHPLAVAAPARRCRLPPLGGYAAGVDGPSGSGATLPAEGGFATGHE